MQRGGTMPDGVPPILGGGRIVPDRFDMQQVAFERLGFDELAEAEHKLDAAFNAAETIGLRVNNGDERLTKRNDRSVHISAEMAWRLSEFAESLMVHAESVAAFAAEISGGAKRIWREQDSRESRSSGEPQA
jgi:hypothetical protein